MIIPENLRPVINKMRRNHKRQRLIRNKLLVDGHELGIFRKAV